jgi:hydrogenase maturation protease
LFIERLRSACAGQAGVEFLDDYQLQPEHALDLVGRERVLFVDASLRCQAPFEATEIAAAQDASFTTHAMSPQALMHVYRSLHGEDPPPCSLLAIRGEHFELGEPPSPLALAHLAAALAWAEAWLGLRMPQAKGEAQAAHA